MPKIKYVEKNLSPGKLATIAKANEIIADYNRQGFQLTLRQLYYQFVARDLIPNNEKSYDNLGAAINDARLCGLIDWYAITDLTRNLVSNSHWDDPSDIIRGAAGGFRIDKWEGQEFRPEVWIEKDALSGIISRVCSDLDVSYFSCRGYTSQSEMWRGAMRLQGIIDAGQTPLIFHFGDHDPSGMDMTRDIRERLELFMGGLKIERLALNYDQVEQYGPPPNPAKLSDSRAPAYVAEFGNESWELDALEPAVLVELVRSHILSVRDEDLWQEKVDEENQHRAQLGKTSERWDDVVEFLEAE